MVIIANTCTFFLRICLLNSVLLTFCLTTDIWGFTKLALCKRIHKNCDCGCCRPRNTKGGSMFRKTILIGVTVASALVIASAQAKTIRMAEHRQARIDALNKVVPEIEKNTMSTSK